MSSKIPALRLPSRTTSDSDDINDISHPNDQTIVAQAASTKPARPSSASSTKVKAPPQPSIVFGSRSNIARRAPCTKTAHTSSTTSILATTGILDQKGATSILYTSNRSSGGGADQAPVPSPSPAGGRMERPKSASNPNQATLSASKSRPSSVIKQRQPEASPAPGNNRPQRPLSASSSASKAGRPTTIAQPSKKSIMDDLQQPKEAKGSKPVFGCFKLDLSALKQKSPAFDHQPPVHHVPKIDLDHQPPVHHVPKIDLSAQPIGSLPSTPATALVPKLNLLPMLTQQRLDDAADDNQMASHQEQQIVEEHQTISDKDEPLSSGCKKSGKPSTPQVKSNSSKKQQQTSSKPPAKVIEEPAEHFYFYPKMDRKEETKTLGLINTLPKQASNHIKKIYDSMVEAKQNCEAIAFRGHRLLDQLNGHMKEQLSKAEQREVDLQSQLSDYQSKVQQQEAQLQSLMMVLQGLQGLGMMDLNGLGLDGAASTGGDGRGVGSNGGSNGGSRRCTTESARSWGGSSGGRDSNNSQAPRQSTAQHGLPPSQHGLPPSTVASTVVDGDRSSCHDMFFALNHLAEGMKTMRESVNQMSSRYAGKFS